MPPVKNDKTEKTCLWCGNDTTNDSTEEHIFPECIGGKKTLPAGYVCHDCNEGFSHRIDRALLKEHPALMEAYQRDPGIKRKGRGKEKRERYKTEKNRIEGVGDAASTEILRNAKELLLINASYAVGSEDFVRSLHKCAANVLCSFYGPKYVKKNYQSLLAFVKSGGDIYPWSYAVSYAKITSSEQLLVSEPDAMKFNLTKTTNKHDCIISWAHASGIWMVGSSPSLLNPEIIKDISSKMVVALPKRFNETKGPITAFFGFKLNEQQRDYLGELNFTWIVKELAGKPNPNYLYLLTKCRLCGQTNPTGITLPRKIIYTGNTHESTCYPENNWNRYTKTDLRKLGFNIDKWDKDSSKTHMEQCLRLPIKNDVKKLKIVNCYRQCINCKNLIKFSAKDCFV